MSPTRERGPGRGPRSNQDQNDGNDHIAEWPERRREEMDARQAMLHAADLICFGLQEVRDALFELADALRDARADQGAAP